MYIFANDVLKGWFHDRRLKATRKVVSFVQALGLKTKACRYYTQLLDFTAPATLPRVTLIGLEPAACPVYKPDRRPELKAAQSYVRETCHALTQ